MKDILKDRLTGCILGYAIGDALGKGTEFMTRDIVRRRYPNGLRTYGGIIRDSHRSQWKSNQWTNDTEVVIRMCEAIAASGDLTVADQAEMLKLWYEQSPFDVVPVMRWVLSQGEYLSDPHRTAQNVWDMMPRLEASNEALGRAMVAGLWPDDPIGHAVDMCMMTHCDSRCVCTAKVIASVAHSLLWNGKEPEYETLVEICRDTDERTLPYLEIAREGTLEDLELDDPDTLWYTRKAMGAALHALWHADRMTQAAYRLVDQGGDADTNTSLALGLLGLKLGKSALPEYLTEELMEHDRAVKAAEQFAEVLCVHAGI